MNPPLQDSPDRAEQLPVYEHTLTLGDMTIDVLSLTPSFTQVYYDYQEKNKPIGYITKAPEAEDDRPY